MGKRGLLSRWGATDSNGWQRRACRNGRVVSTEPANSKSEIELQLEPSFLTPAASFCRTVPPQAAEPTMYPKGIRSNPLDHPDAPKSSPLQGQACRCTPSTSNCSCIRREKKRAKVQQWPKGKKEDPYLATVNFQATQFIPNFKTTRLTTRLHSSTGSSLVSLFNLQSQPLSLNRRRKHA